MTTLRPIQDRLAVELDPRDTQSSGGIIFSDHTIAKNKPYWGLVRCVGPEVEHCTEGDRVFVPWELGTAILLDGKEIVLLREAQVLAKEVSA